ncbi:GTP pyrophosphokinase [Sphingobacterium haloxyli]|uniref:RelA/SpoT domain-containing protein n=1 Tax=Sphingobacterium haloxyli TaxID=2100533 RepID=A0A2S9J6P8_9SPHI|nr:RelA/SpoT domain-containing protein [Sphingobacterium haloxyli]PRD48430.1 hypothetical protein C5745_04285 [Sphingobacterium haloxyli]
MKIIDNFITAYDTDFYQKQSQIIAEQIEDQLFKRGIKAMVTFRAKKRDRLRDKLIKRNADKRYHSMEDILEDIVDLAGIRVSLYFPSERDVIDEIITDIFNVEKKKIFPTEAHTPKHAKRFSGYWATHYRIRYKDEHITAHNSIIAEIQVASVLMHAWSEVEHDLVYKPYSGFLSREELSILDEINGMVLSGEIALERLQSAMAERTKQKNAITNKYELTNFLISAIDKEYKNKIKIGDTYLLNNYLNTIKKLDTNQFIDFINKIDVTSQESATDQLLNMLLLNYQDNDGVSLRNYFKNLGIADRKVSSCEAFIRRWVMLEQQIRALHFEEEIGTTKAITYAYKIIKNNKFLTDEEILTLDHLGKLRNDLLHGIRIPTERSLKESLELLTELSKKLINSQDA